VQGAPEDQLRAPFEHLLLDLAELTGLPRSKVVAVGETRLAEQHIRPDYAVTVPGALAGYVEIKAPGKGADPRRFKGEHDKVQWKRLQSLPNLLYTDGSEFSLWHNGERTGEVVRLDAYLACGIHKGTVERAQRAGTVGGSGAGAGRFTASNL